MRKQYDFCALYSIEDFQRVNHIAMLLKDKNIEVFFDEWCLIPGKPKQEQIESAIENSKVIGVFIGKKGLDGWLDDTSRIAVENRLKHASKGVIPIFLPNSNHRKIPQQFHNLASVHFKQNIKDDDAFIKLVAGIKQKSPAELMTRDNELGGVLVVEDIPHERNEYSLAIQREWPGVDIRKVGNVDEALHHVETLRPQIVVLDLMIENSINNGFELLRTLNEVYPYIKILILSQFDTDEPIARLSPYVFHGFLSKHELERMEQLVNAVRLINEGKRYYSPGVLAVMQELEFDSSKKLGSNIAKSDEMKIYNTLGPRSKEVFEMLGKFGYKNKQIAILLEMREKGVERHLSTLFKKFGVENRHQLKLIWYKLHNSARMAEL